MTGVKTIVAIIIFLALSTSLVVAQDLESENARTALKAGSSKELMTMLHHSFELILFDKKYNKDNSESVLRDFFSTNPASDFKFIHNGASKDGTLSYSIGHYETTERKYRVVIRFKKSSENFKIHKLEVSDF